MTLELVNVFETVVNITPYGTEEKWEDRQCYQTRIDSQWGLGFWQEKIVACSIVRRRFSSHNF